MLNRMAIASDVSFNISRRSCMAAGRSASRLWPVAGNAATSPRCGCHCAGQRGLHTYDLILNAVNDSRQEDGLTCRRLLVRLRPSGRLTRLQDLRSGCDGSIMVAEIWPRARYAEPFLRQSPACTLLSAQHGSWGLQAFLLVTIYLALQVDVFVARSQRRQLGLCEDCGGVNDPASCPQPGCPMRVAGDQL